MKSFAVVLVTLCVLVDVMMAVPVNYPRYAPNYADRYRRQEQMNDPRMVQYQQIYQARQAEELRRAQMSAGQFVPSMNAALAPLMAQQQAQLPYDRSSMGIPQGIPPQLSMQPLPMAPAQLPPDLRQQVPAAFANPTMAQQVAAVKQQAAAPKAKIPQSEEQREAMEMFNEKVDLGLFVNNDIQPNVVMMEGKRSDMPAATESADAPVGVTDDGSDHEIAKKSDISKAKDSSPAIVNDLSASMKSDAQPAKPTESRDTNTESRDNNNKIENKISAPAPVRVQDEEEKRSVKNTVTCQGEKEWLQCPTYHLIKIHSAFWGRDDSKACTRSGIQHALSTEKTCAQDESNTMLKVQNSCDGENVCEVVASPLFFDRHDCPDTYKFLRLNWECARSESRIKENLDRDAPKLVKKDTIPSDLVSTDDLLAKEKVAEPEASESKPVETSKDESTSEEKKPDQKEIDSNDVTRRDGILEDSILHRDGDYEKSISEVMVADSSADAGTGFAVQDGDSADQKKKEADLMKKKSEEDTKTSEVASDVADQAGSGDQAPTAAADAEPVVPADQASNDTSALASNDTSTPEANATSATNKTADAGSDAANQTVDASTDAANQTADAGTDAANQTADAGTGDAANLTADTAKQTTDAGDAVSKSDTPAAAAADTGSGSGSSDLMQEARSEPAGSGDGNGGDASGGGSKKSSVVFV